MKKFLLPFALLLSVVFACRKNTSDDTNQSQDTRLTLLAKAVWNKTNEGLDNNKDGEIDVVDGHFLPCNADDKVSFQVNGTLLWMEGPTKCSSTAPDSYTLNWWLMGSDGINMLSRDWKIYKLTETELSVYYDYSASSWEMMQFKR